MFKRRIVLFALLAYASLAKSQSVALKTNILYLGATTPNLTMEVGLTSKLSLDLSAAYNPWTFQHGKKMRFWLAQPELKYWFCESFEGHYLGVHIHGAQYYGGFSERLYDGYLAGAGVSYGYDWILSPHWNLEASLGLGYARLWYKDMSNDPCLKCYENKHRNYWGPTKIALSVSYLF